MRRSRFSSKPAEPQDFQAPAQFEQNDEYDDRRRKRNKWGDANDYRPTMSSGPVRVEDNLRKTNPALSFNAPMGGNRGEGSMIRKKIYLPQDGVNYIGLLIGPKGMFQKKLEGESGCKILIRGRGSQKEGQPPQPDDDDDQHVLIMGDTQDAVERGIASCNRIINADEETRNMIRKEQLKVAAEINNDNKLTVDESMLTPYGPPSPYAYILPVPNESIGLIIGKKGETIRRLQLDSGAKIQVAKKEVEETKQRYVFIEGPEDKYQHAKQLIEEIVEEWKRNHQPHNIPLETQPSDGPSQVIPIPDNLIGLLTNSNRNEQDIITCIHERYSVKVYIPNQPDSAGNRNVEVSGEPDKIVRAIEDLFNFLREKSPGTNLMMNPLYYASVMGWNKSTDFAYPGEVPRQESYPGYPPMGAGYPPYGMHGGYPGAHPMHAPYAYPEHNPHYNPNPYDNRHEMYHHPEHASSPSPRHDPGAHHSRPAHGHPHEEIKGESRPPAAPEQPVEMPSASADPWQQRAHEYADHYAKTLGGDYQYYFDYYMKTYAGTEAEKAHVKQ